MFKYETIQELVDAAQASGRKISDIFIEDQARSMEISPEEIIARMDEAFQVMIDCTVRGADKDLRSHSGLTGGEGYKMLSYATDAPEGGWMGSYMTKAVGRALSASVSNAAMGKIVAAPTAGSCGILPGCLVSAYEDRGMDREACVRALFTAGAFGLVVANVASIAGAEGGCQAECGSASGMAAAALVELRGGSPQQTATAMGIAIVNQMGLVCDPVAGLVEIPCIKRNASGVMIAFTAADMALSGIDLKIPVDECISAMKAVGDSMPEALRETAGGGLAATPTGKKLREQVFGKKED